MWFLLQLCCSFCHRRNFSDGEVDWLLSDADAQRLLLYRITSRVASWWSPSIVGSSSSLGLSRDSWYWNACGLVTLEDLFAVRASNSYTGASIVTARSAGPGTRRSWYSQSEQDWYCPRLVCALVNTGHVRIHGLRRGDCFCIQPV